MSGSLMTRNRLQHWRGKTIGCLTLLLLTGTPGRAQDDRTITNPTAWWWYPRVTAEQLGQYVNQNGARITDIELVPGASSLLFTAVLVKNAGPYAAGWWWFYDQSGEQVRQNVTQNHARIADIELMGVRPDARFAVVLVDNSGSRAVPSNWTAGSVSPENAGDYLSGLTSAGMRMSDFDPNDHLGGYTTTVEIGDAAARAGWLWYPNLTVDQIGQRLNEHGARLVDIEYRPGNRFSALMVKSKGEAWWWYPSLTAQQVGELAQQNTARVIDIETRIENGQQRFAAVMVENRSRPANPALTAVRPPAMDGAGEADKPPPATTGDGERVASGYVCTVRRMGSPSSLRVVLSAEAACEGPLTGDVIFPGDGQEGPLSKIGVTEQAMNTFKANGQPISITYVVQADGRHRAIRFDY